jgi:hypothetical protein
MFAHKRFVFIVFLLSVFSVQSKAGTYCNTPTVPCETGTVWNEQMCKCVATSQSTAGKVSPNTAQPMPKK